MQHQTHTNENKKAIGVAGAIIGAGVALAAAKILSDKKNRKKIMETLDDMKGKVMNGFEIIQDEPKQTKKNTRQKVTATPKPTKTVQKKQASRPRDEHGRFLKKEDTNPNPPTPS